MHTRVFPIHQLSLLCMTNIGHCSLPLQVLMCVSSVAVSQIYYKIAPFLQEGVLAEIRESCLHSFLLKSVVTVKDMPYSFE